MKYCPTCGNAVDDAVKFCFRCGHAFPVAPVYPADTAAPAPAEDAPAQDVPETNAIVDAPAPEPIDATPVEEAADAVPAADAPEPEAAEPSSYETEDAPEQEPPPFVMETAAPAPAPAPVPDPQPVPPVKPAKQLLSTIQYILLIILFSVPVVGLVFLFVFGCGNPKNASLKRFSLAVLILTLIVWILIIAAAIVGYVAYADTLPGFLRAFQQWFAALDLSALGL